MTKKKICGIYKIENLINGKLYIGQSIDIHKRWKEHKNQLNRNSHENDHLQKSWNKYGKQKFKFEIIKDCLSCDLDDEEFYYIKYYNSMNSNYGYNKTSGGSKGKEISDETRRKLSESNMFIHRGENSERVKYSTKQVRLAKMLIYCGMDFQEISKITDIPRKYITKIKNLNRWCYLLEELNDEIRKFGKLHYDKSIPIIMFDKKMNELKRFKSATIASSELGFSNGSISGCCIGNQLMAYNYIWLYDDENLIYNITKRKKQLTENKIYLIHRIDEGGNILETFNCISDAANKYNLDIGAVGRVCNGKFSNTKGYRFIKEYV